jgi:hypothetical protein
MSEVDLNMQQLDFSKLNNDMSQMNDTLVVLNNLFWYLAGTSTVIVGFLTVRCFKKQCRKKENIVHLSEESIALLSTSVKNVENQMSKLEDKIAVAVKVKEEETEYSPLVPPTELV